MKKIILVLFGLLFIIAACGGPDEGELATESSEVRRGAQSFTIPHDPKGPDDLTTPTRPPPVASYELCCFGESCTTGGGTCAFSTWICSGKTETREGTVYTGCECTKHCG